MLKQIKKDQVPKEVWDGFETIPHFFEFYETDGMFGILPDFLLIMEICENDRYYGYVYNGNAPECSEFGSFGINKDKTARIW